MEGGSSKASSTPSLPSLVDQHGDERLPEGVGGAEDGARGTRDVGGGLLALGQLLRVLLVVGGLLLVGELLLDVGVLDAEGVALGQAAERRGRAVVDRRVVEALEVEVLVLQGVGELVHERDLEARRSSPCPAPGSAGRRGRRTRACRRRTPR